MAITARGYRSPRVTPGIRGRRAPPHLLARSPRTTSRSSTPPTADSCLLARTSSSGSPATESLSSGKDKFHEQRNARHAAQAAMPVHSSGSEGHTSPSERPASRHVGELAGVARRPLRPIGSVLRASVNPEERGVKIAARPRARGRRSRTSLYAGTRRRTATNPNSPGRFHMAQNFSRRRSPSSIRSIDVRMRIRM